jgi:hypothetical protein
LLNVKDNKDIDDNLTDNFEFLKKENELISNYFLDN